MSIGRENIFNKCGRVRGGGGGGGGVSKSGHLRTKGAGVKIGENLRKSFYGCPLCAIGAPHYIYLRFRYTCDDNCKRFAIIVPFAVFLPHWNVRYSICDFSRSITITANMLHLRLSYLRRKRGRRTRGRRTQERDFPTRVSTRADPNFYTS